MIQRLNDELGEARELAYTEKHKSAELQGILQDERKENKQQADESAKQINHLQGTCQLRQLQEETAALREQMDDGAAGSREELQGARDEVKALKRALEAAAGERDCDVAAAKANLATVSKDLDKWRQAADKYEREIADLQRDLQQQSKQASAPKNLQSMQAECNGLQKECSALRAERQDVASKQQKERNKGNLQGDCAALRSEKEAALQSSRAQNAELSDSLKALERSQQELEKRLAALQLQHQQDSSKLQTQISAQLGLIGYFEVKYGPCMNATRLRRPIFLSSQWRFVVNTQPLVGDAVHGTRESFKMNDLPACFITWNETLNADWKPIRAQSFLGFRTLG
uniref:Sarcolemma associated protein b n=1 Tax=Cyclopterus lumpus TaxID=8103 RepID=A0A8C2X7Y2_CYCLU